MLWVVESHLNHMNYVHWLLAPVFVEPHESLCWLLAPCLLWVVPQAVWAATWSFWCLIDLYLNSFLIRYDFYPFVWLCCYRWNFALTLTSPTTTALQSSICTQDKAGLSIYLSTTEGLVLAILESLSMDWIQIAPKPSINKSHTKNSPMYVFNQSIKIYLWHKDKHAVGSCAISWTCYPIW